MNMTKSQALALLADATRDDQPYWRNDSVTNAQAVDIIEKAVIVSPEGELEHRLAELVKNVCRIAAWPPPATMPMRFTKRPVTVEAMFFDGSSESGHAIKRWSCGAIYWRNLMTMEIRTPEGVLELKENTYVIRGVRGEFYPCKPDIFAEIYEEAT